MKLWAALSDRFPGRKRRSYEAALRLSQAYRAVFNGQPSREQQQIVLTDLHAQCGFTQVSPSNVASGELRYREGMRAAYALIHAHLTLSPDDVAAIENAARRENATLSLDAT